jgi:hypothetical protein
MIGGIVIGVLVVVALVLVFVLVNRRRQQQKPVEAHLAELDEKPDKEKINGNDDSAKPEEKESLLPPEVAEMEVVDHDDDEEGVDLRPKFASPIWIDEIQKNKIFNRQKSLLSEESIKDLASDNQQRLKEVEEEIPEIVLPATEQKPTSYAPSPPPQFEDVSDVDLESVDKSKPDPAAGHESGEESNTESDQGMSAAVEDVKPKIIETDI